MTHPPIPPALHDGPVRVTVPTATLTGVAGRSVEIEVTYHPGAQTGFRLVDSDPGTARALASRLRPAILNSGFPWPPGRIKVGVTTYEPFLWGKPWLELAVAVGVLAAAGWINPGALANQAFLGELGLDGSLQAVPGLIPLVEGVDPREVTVPPTQARTAQLVADRAVRTATDLRSLVEGLRASTPSPGQLPRPVPFSNVEPVDADLGDITGFAKARYALEIAAAGGHHLLLVGAPGTGGLMLARRLPGLLPDLDDEDAMDITRIHSAAGLQVDSMITRPPFRAINGQASLRSVLGGGSTAVRPGELSLAHCGVLLIEELSQLHGYPVSFLTDPLRRGTTHVAGEGCSAVLPAAFLLVATCSPCPCGSTGTMTGCHCTPAVRRAFLPRPSRALVARFALRVNLAAADIDDTFPIPLPSSGESTAEVALRVLGARRTANARGVAANADLPAVHLARLAQPTPDANRCLGRAIAAGRLDEAGVDDVVRVALTIADLQGDEPPLEEEHVEAALALRVGWPIETG